MFSRRVELRKGSSREKKSSIRELRNSLASLSRDANSDDVVDRLSKLLPAGKTDDDCVVVHRCANIRATLMLVAGVPMAFQPEGWRVVPSVRLLWMSGLSLPTIVLAPRAATFILRGSDVMMPGVMGFTEGCDVGRVAAVCIARNPVPFAVGRVLFAPQSWSPEQSDGRVLHTLNVFGDRLFEMGADSAGLELPPGFTYDEGTPCVVPVSEQGEAGSVADSNSGAPVSAGDSDAQTEEGSQATESSAEDMDSLLRSCLLQAISSKAVKPKQLPMEAPLFYSMIRSCRPEGTSVDVRLSSHRKLLPWLKAMEVEGVVELQSIKEKGKSGETVKVTSVEFRHPLVRQHSRWDCESSLEGAGASGAAVGTGVALTLKAPFRLVWIPRADQEHFAATLSALVGPAAVEAGLTKETLIVCLNQYADSKQLRVESNKKRIGIDPALQILLGSETDKAMRVDAMASCLLDRMECCISQRVPPSEHWSRPVKGPLPAVKISTKQKRGHAMTIVAGLDTVGVDTEELASAMQVIAAASASVKAKGPQQAIKVVQIQGCRERTVGRLLVEAGVPSRCITIDGGIWVLRKRQQVVALTQ